MTDPYIEGTFNRLLKDIPDKNVRLSIITVTDTAYMVMQWMQAYGVPFTAADLLGFTNAILTEERVAREREQAEMAALNYEDAPV